MTCIGPACDVGHTPIDPYAQIDFRRHTVSPESGDPQERLQVVVMKHTIALEALLLLLEAPAQAQRTQTSSFRTQYGTTYCVTTAHFIPLRTS